VVVDLLLHGLRLAADQFGQRARALAGLGEHHRDRGLQGVRQIADVGALAFDDLLVVFDKGVELLGQRHDLAGIGAGHPLRLAAAHRGDLVLQVVERTQADPDLDDDRHH
jgi:hypothetical protein